MRILLSAVAATLIATAASAGGAGGATSDATVMSPHGGAGKCNTIFVTGKDYCIGGVIYPG
ncbi:hypothetical protein [Ovoidimarina sediminis]|uniref:hypothetical protein n=1 Tax=Ovoidimarina sediminis TaxID=3079856 RepID=UPI00290EB1C0|nr:hypothetical protein [Rhodophyticola sp. MJ-SS7]MDU8946192.1 hypothetical protein [Rhodophyticola sp. MJ-SS7]